MNKNKKDLTITIISSILIATITIALAGWPGLQAKLIFSSCAYAAATYWVYSRTSLGRKGLLVLLLPILSIHVIGHTIEYENISVSIPASFGPFIGMLAGWLFSRKGSVLTHKAVPITLLLCCFFFASIGYPRWMFYLNFGTFSGRTVETLSGPLQLHALDKTDISPNTFAQKTQVLDFWTTGCGICFQEFPIFEKLNQKYKQHTQVQCYAVNIPYRDQTDSLAESLIRKRNYTFPTLYAADKSVAELLNIETYPTTLIVHNGTVIYRGDVEGVEKVLNELASKS